MKLTKNTHAVVLLALLLALTTLLVGCNPFQHWKHEKAVDHYVSALSLESADFDQDAIFQLEKAVQLDPDFALAHSRLGDVYREQGQYDQAANAYESACRLDPWAFPDHLNLGQVYKILERFSDAIRVLRRACQLRPDNASANYTLGACYYETENYEQAKTYCTRAAQIEPNNEENPRHSGRRLQQNRRRLPRHQLLQTGPRTRPRERRHHGPLGHRLRPHETIRPRAPHPRTGHQPSPRQSLPTRRPSLLPPHRTKPPNRPRTLPTGRQTPTQQLPSPQRHRRHLHVHLPRQPPRQTNAIRRPRSLAPLPRTKPRPTPNQTTTRKILHHTITPTCRRHSPPLPRSTGILPVYHHMGVASTVSPCHRHRPRVFRPPPISRIPQTTSLPTAPSNSSEAKRAVSSRPEPKAKWRDLFPGLAVAKRHLSPAPSAPHLSPASLKPQPSPQPLPAQAKRSEQCHLDRSRRRSGETYFRTSRRKANLSPAPSAPHLSPASLKPQPSPQPHPTQAKRSEQCHLDRSRRRSGETYFRTSCRKATPFPRVFRPPPISRIPQTTTLPTAPSRSSEAKRHLPLPRVPHSPPCHRMMTTPQKNHPHAQKRKSHKYIPKNTLELTRNHPTKKLIPPLDSTDYIGILIPEYHNKQDDTLASRDLNQAYLSGT